MTEKSQAVRAMDVLIIGPFMLYAATKLRGADRAWMTLLGMLTIAYNGMNFLSNVNGDETRKP